MEKKNGKLLNCNNLALGLSGTMKLCVKLFETVQLLLDHEGALETSERLSAAQQNLSAEELPFAYLSSDTEKGILGGAANMKQRWRGCMLMNRYDVCACTTPLGRTIGGGLHVFTVGRQSTG